MFNKKNVPYTPSKKKWKTRRMRGKSLNLFHPKMYMYVCSIIIKKVLCSG